MNFRRLSVSDFEDIKKIQLAYKRAIHEAIPTQDGFLKLKLAIEQSRIEFFGAYDGDKLVAACSVAKVFSTFRYEDYATIEDLYVLTTYRGNKVSKDLLAFVKKETGMVLSLTCQEEYTPFFRSLGFNYDLGESFLRNE